MKEGVGALNCKKREKKIVSSLKSFALKFQLLGFSKAVGNEKDRRGEASKNDDTFTIFLLNVIDKKS